MWSSQLSLLNFRVRLLKQLWKFHLLRHEMLPLYRETDHDAPVHGKGFHSIHLLIADHKVIILPL